MLCTNSYHLLVKLTFRGCKMLIAITCIIMTLIICATIIAGIFLYYRDNFSYWKIEKDLKEINQKLDKLIKNQSDI